MFRSRAIIVEGGGSIFGSILTGMKLGGGGVWALYTPGSGRREAKSDRGVLVFGVGVGFEEREAEGDRGVFGAGVCFVECGAGEDCGGLGVGGVLTGGDARGGTGTGGGVRRKAPVTVSRGHWLL